MEKTLMSGGAAAPLDPEIQEFATAIQQGYTEHADGEDRPLAEARAIAEIVRKPWVEGGPEMARVTDHHVPFGDKSVRIRLFEPTHETEQPALIYLHGGGWTIFSLDTHDRLMREYADRAGIKVIGVDYSLAPEYKFPLQIDQILAVVNWLELNGPSLGVDASRLAIGGDSAGGNLTVAACLKLRDADRLNNIRAMVLNYGAYQVDQVTESHKIYGKGDYPLTIEEMNSFWDNYLTGKAEQQNPLACPIYADVHGLPPAFMAITECDILYDENIAMAKKFRDAGVAVEAIVYPGTTHSFLEAVSIAAVSDRAFSDESVWLARMLKQ